MIKIDLITGFLGSGKTTFIRKYVEYLISQGNRVGIVENDFGAVNVDMMLLQDLEGEFCDIEPIVGGTVATDWKRRFKAKLIAFSMQGFDRVVVEPSGIYDVDTFFEVLYDEPLDSWYEIGNVLTVVDARLDAMQSEQAEYLLMSQIADCGLVVLSKVSDATKEEIQKTTSHISQLLKKYECDREIENDIFVRNWDEMMKDDFEKLVHCGWKSTSHKNLWFDKNEVFTSLYFMDAEFPENEIGEHMGALMRDTSCGKIFRIKGFLQQPDGEWLEVNATKDHLTIKPIAKGQRVFIVIGEGLSEEKISCYFHRK